MEEYLPAKYHIVVIGDSYKLQLWDQSING